MEEASRETTASKEGDRRLRPGDVVELRPAAEILATLDSNASLGGMPFMPEMLQHAGKRLTVSRRVEKICNNVDDTQTPGRRMRSTVHLEELRCDGSGHDGCQLGCRIYWKEEWLPPRTSNPTRRRTGWRGHG